MQRLSEISVPLFLAEAMIAALSPAGSDHEETTSTLQQLGLKMILNRLGGVSYLTSAWLTSRSLYKSCVPLKKQRWIQIESKVHPSTQ